MTLADLLDAYRNAADDETEPYRADDARVTGWLNEAVDEACLRAKLIFDTTSPLCTLRVVAGTQAYVLHPAIDDIAAAWMDKHHTVLQPTDQSALDRGRDVRWHLNSPSWRAAYVDASAWCGSNWRMWNGQPRFIIRDGQSIRLVPNPTSDDVLHLEVYRRPLAAEKLDAANATTCVPRVSFQYQPALVEWALYRAFMRRDEDQVDPAVAAAHLQLFEAAFGPRTDANVVRKQHEQRSHTTVINWP